MFVGIPTLNRYDLLEDCLQSLSAGDIPPTQVVVIDNGRAWETPEGCPFPLWVVRPERNLGVAASWNLLKRIAGDQDIVLTNDDVMFAPDTLARMIECPHPFISICDTPGFEARRDDPQVRVSDWSCFLQRAEVWRRVGDYDETFWPGGYEDNDYWRRMQLVGLSVTRLPQAGMTHQVSSTIQMFSMEEHAALNRATEFNAAYYLRKWGGPPGWEQYACPFVPTKIPAQA